MDRWVKLAGPSMERTWHPSDFVLNVYCRFGIIIVSDGIYHLECRLHQEKSLACTNSKIITTIIKNGFLK